LPFVVIARAALSARGNPETDKAFAVAVSENAVAVFHFPSPLAGEDGLQSKHGEGSPFLKCLLPFSYFAVAVRRGSAVIARALCRPWQSRN
jgi:hypothetical protein